MSQQDWAYLGILLGAVQEIRLSAGFEHIILLMMYILHDLVHILYYICYRRMRSAVEMRLRLPALCWKVGSHAAGFEVEDHGFHELVSSP